MTRGAAATRAIEDRVRAGVGFLLDGRSSGCWTDWDLPPGRSTTWNTAYVGLKIAGLPARFGAPASPALRSAARWLRRRELPGRGWGYSDRTARDADSTAHAILFLSRVAAPIPDGTYLSLLRYQQPDGGFSTYGADEGLGSWGNAHVDVSAAAALAVRPVADAFERTVGYVLGRRRPDGLWNSFWWSSPLYATRASLALLQAAGATVDLAPTRTTLRRARPGNAFERALRLEALDLCGEGPALTDALAADLAAEQLADGSWPSAPVLRVTRRTCTEPWRDPDAGELYADPDRLFTSATVVAALAHHVCRSTP